MLWRYLITLGLPLLLFAQSTPNAQEQYAQLRQHLRDARQAGDKQAAIKAIIEIEQFVHETPASVATLAQVYATLGDDDHAQAALNQLAEMGQSDDDLLNDEVFSALKKSPQYAQLAQHFAENKSSISHADIAFSLADPGILAEDIDFDPQSKSFFITSVLEKKIIRVSPNGNAKDFAESPSHWPMLAVKVDAKRKLVWATEVAMDGFIAAPKSDWGRSALLAFDLNTGKMVRRIEGPAKSALGDMVLTANGTPIVSDGAGGGVYRVEGNHLDRIDGGDFISPQTPAMHPDGKHVFVPDYVRGIGILDLATKQVRWLDGQHRYALSGIDGLYFDHGSLIATQNGTSPERVVRFKLDPTLSRIVSEEVIERSTPTLGDPTHGVV